MKWYVERNHPNSQQRLKRLGEQAWNAIPPNIIRGYINNITNICSQIPANNACQSIG